ncbi:unnamed protein product [Polarella glacialis]|uniref:RNA-binding protein n=1 Tax=Polarella glacialis TaxID=89957 RepID=A0A813H2S8_POLGL|nr:unnamed protein product [Polarella glacialis]
MVLVEGLPLTSDVTSEAMVKQFFEHFGPVHEVRIDRDDQGAVRGTARVIFDSCEVAKDVVARYGPEAREVVEFLGNALGITTVHYNRLSPACVAGKGDARKQAQKGEKGDKGPTVRKGEKGDKGKGKGFGEDWTCPNCGVMVFASKSECFKCGTGKHSDAGGKGKGVDLVCKGGFDAGRSDPTEKIFIAGVPKDLTEHALAEYYSKFGAVKELHLPFDTDTGQLRGFCFITFETCEAAAEAVKTGGLGEARLDYGQKKGGGKKAAEAPRPTDFFLRVSELPDNPRQRDTFKLFYSYSTARFRDFGSEAIVEFVSVGECQKAFDEKQGARMGSARIILSAATREEFLAMKATQDLIPGSKDERRRSRSRSRRRPRRSRSRSRGSGRRSELDAFGTGPSR